MSVKELRPGGPVPPNGTGNGARPSSDGPLTRLSKAIYRQAPEVWDNLRPRVLGHNIYKSIYRTTAFPKTERERSEAFFNSFLLHIQPAKIEKHALRFTYTFGLGLLSLYLFLMLTVSGLLLMFVYVPSTEQAYLRMQDLHSSVSFGYILRGMHFWSANAMIAAVFFHMCRVFYTGAYKAPREFNWVDRRHPDGADTGSGLYRLPAALGPTGLLGHHGRRGHRGQSELDFRPYQCPAAPAVSPRRSPTSAQLTRWGLLGADTVGQEALIRFYVLHVAILPVIMGMFIVYHMWRIRKDGGISSPKESPE